MSTKGSWKAVLYSVNTGEVETNYIEDDGQDFEEALREMLEDLKLYYGWDPSDFVIVKMEKISS